MNVDMRRPEQADDFQESVAEFFRVLGEPARLRLIQGMTMKCKAVSTLVAETGLAQPLVSHHLRTLKDAGIARAERKGAFVFY
jgi:ArsR family transcriptional regulator, zinc-responsive transcriptional repressor